MSPSERQTSVHLKATLVDGLIHQCSLGSLIPPSIIYQYLCMFWGAVVYLSITSVTLGTLNL